MPEVADNKSITLNCNEKTDNKIENIKREIHYLYEMHECKYFVHIYNDYQFQWEHGIDFMIQMELLTPITEYFRIHDVSEKELLKLGMHICKALICLEEKGMRRLLLR